MPDDPGARKVSLGGAPPRRPASPPVMLELLGPGLVFGTPVINPPARALLPSPGPAIRSCGPAMGGGPKPPGPPSPSPPRGPDQPGRVSPGGRAVAPPLPAGAPA